MKKRVPARSCLLLLATLLAVSPMLLAAKQAVTGTLTMLEPIDPSSIGYGDQVVFGVVTEGKLDRHSRVYVTLVCTQDTGNVVYQVSNWTDYAFLLVDLPGQGLEWDGGSAVCSAALIYWVEKGKTASIEYLDSIDFYVQGGIV